MEFESKVAGFATGLLLLGSYIVRFDLWEYSSFLMVLSSLLLLMVAFWDHKPGRIDLIAFLMAIAISVFFLNYLSSNAYLPLVVVLILSLIAINAKVETFIPPLVGLLVLQFFNPIFLLKGLNIIFINLSSLLNIRYGIGDSGYLVLYHTRTHLPIFIDDVKILLPFYSSLLAAGLVLLAILNTDRKTIVKSVPIMAVIPILFLILTLKNLLYSPGIANFILDNFFGLALPLTCVLLFFLLIPGARLKKIQTESFSLKRKTVLLLIAFFVLAIAYYTPFTARSDPIIIIDETHSEWEPAWTDYLLNYAKDPVSGVNNYFGLMNLLSSLYDTTLIIDRPEKKPVISSVGSVLVDEITTKVLENISHGRKAVMVVKCVTRPYSQSEIDAIMNFAAKGNGLILVGEHTDLFGVDSNLNPISERLGYRNLFTGVEDIYGESRGAITQKGEFPSLMARYMTEDQSWETGNSLEKLNDVKPLFEVRTRPSFFADFRNETAAFFLTRDYTDEVKLNSEFGQHLVMTGINYGAGKVILFTDSTEFNNGGIFDHAQLFLAMVEYVSGKEKLDKVLLPFLLVAVAMMVIILNRRMALTVLVMLSLLILIAFNLSYPLAHYTTAFPELKSDPKIAILNADKDYYKELYLSGMIDTEKLMDKYFHQNLTAVVISNPPNDWIGISAKVDNLSDFVEGEAMATKPKPRT